jgi:hypothetical protein
VFAFDKKCVAPNLGKAKIVLNNYETVESELKPYQFIIYEKEGK